LRGNELANDANKLSRGGSIFFCGFCFTVSGVCHVCHCTRVTHPCPAIAPSVFVLMAEHGSAHGYHVIHDLSSQSGSCFLFGYAYGATNDTK
jgi:hypothetical protein